MAAMIRTDLSGAKAIAEKGNQRSSGMQKESPKPLQIADLGNDVRLDAMKNESRPGRNRTRDQGIMSQRVTAVNPRENAHSQDGAALAQQFSPKTLLAPPDLQAIIDAWPALSDDVRASILAMV
jgi:hypothetical protein